MHDVKENEITVIMNYRIFWKQTHRLNVERHMIPYTQHSH